MSNPSEDAQSEFWLSTEQGLQASTQRGLGAGVLETLVSQGLRVPLRLLEVWQRLGVASGQCTPQGRAPGRPARWSGLGWAGPWVSQWHGAPLGLYDSLREQ